MDRRHFLKKTLAFGGQMSAVPYASALLGQIAHGFIQQAQAEELTGGSNTRIYLNLNIGGGPIRLSFDQWIRTSAGESIVANDYLATAFKSSNGQVTGLDYVTTNYNGTEVPYLFSTQVFNGSGGRRELSEILKNMLVVRGFGTSFDGHDTNALLVSTPITGLPSIGGLIADSNNKLFSAVGGRITSMKNKASTPVDASYLKGLFKAFETNGQNTKTASLKQTNQSSYDLAMGFLKTYARSERLGAKTLSQNLDNASKKMRQGLSDIDSYWPAAVERYRRAVDQTAQQIGIPRISDVPIIRRASGMPDHHFSVFSYYDLSVLGLGGGQRNFMPGQEFDMREMVQTLRIFELAEQFAMAEYMIKGDYSPAIFMGMANFYHTTFQTDSKETPVDEGFNTKRPFAFVHTDMDGLTGPIPALILTHNYYSAILAGVLELKDQLSSSARVGTSQNLWNETVVHITSEFARNAIANGAGTGHGFQHMVSSAYSGAIQNGPYIVGNIKKDYPGLGTNGLMAPIGGSYPVAGPPGPAVMNSTISSLMRVSRNPWANTAPSLINFSESSGAISYPFGKGKIVDG